MATSLCLCGVCPAMLRMAPRLLQPRATLLNPSRGRKSRTDPPAKSKVGRLKMPTPVDPEELVVVSERYRHYQALSGALRSVFKEEVLRKYYDEKMGSLAAERLKHETEEHRMLMACNNAENARLQKLRLERYAQQQEEKKQQVLQAAFDQEANLKEFLKEREEEILELQEAAKHFITPENLDQRIEEALDNPKVFNFAVDKEGRVVKRTVLP